MKLSEIKFSIIIPANNSTDGVKKTLDSLINQTLSFEDNVEVLIVDDISNNAKKSYEEHLNKYPNNIRYFEAEYSMVHNLGLENVKGDYILFLEANDHLSQKTLANVLDFIKSNPNTNLIAIPIYYYKNNRQERYLDYPIKNSSEFNLIETLWPIQLIGPSTFIKKELVNETKFINDYNKYNRFLSEILINHPSLGICKDGDYFIENIEEKTLPTEDVSLNCEEYGKFVEENLNNLIEKSKNNFQEVPKFVQYLLLNQLNWLFTIENSQEKLELTPLEKIVRCIDDEIILNNILVENETKILIFKLKYGNISEDLMDKLNLNTAIIDVYDIINKNLNILVSLTNVSNRNLEILVNGEKIKANELIFPQYDNRSLGHTYTHDYTIEATIPLSTDKKYEIELRSQDKKLKIDFSRECNFSRSVGYAKTKDFLSVLKNEKILIKRKTALNWITQEAKSLVHMIKNHEPGFEKALPFRIAYMIGYPFLKNKRIWFYMDRPEESDDNGLHLFKYAVKKRDGIYKFFILSSDNEDFDEIKKIGRILKYKSLKHRYLGLFVENIISSHPDNGIIYPFWGSYPFFAGLLRSNNIFLQHGILKDNISGWLNKRNMNLSFFLVSSKREYDSTFKYPYNYKKGVVKLRGLPRFDNLENVEDKKQIIIMPSWRRYLTGKSNEYIEETEFFKRFNSLLNNEKLIEKAKEYEYEIIFRPHPNVYNFIDLYDENDYVQIDHEKTKFQTLFNNGSLLITDYSSVAFDFAYLHKPVVYYQYAGDYHFDVENSFFDYETMGLGDVCRNEDDLVNLIIEYIENECRIKDRYSKRIDKFFLFTDKNNCKRVHDEINKIPLKD